MRDGPERRNRQICDIRATPLILLSKITLSCTKKQQLPASSPCPFFNLMSNSHIELTAGNGGLPSGQKGSRAKGLYQMKLSTITKLAPVAIAAILAAAPASAADLYTKAPKPVVVETSMWDIAFGALVQSDYNFRGISQSDRGPGVAAYIEPRYKFGNFEAYVGIGGLSTKLPTSPTAEIDLYGGLRYTAGPVVFDVGGIYYYYPRETQSFYADPFLTSVSPTNFGFGAFTLRDTDFAEVYGKATWTVNDQWTVGGYVYYSPDWLNTGASGLYAGGTVKLTAPSQWFSGGWGAYASAEIAHYWFGTPSAFFTLPFTDYTYWNAGLGFTYKALTLDLRYHDTDLSRGECFALTGDPRGVASGQSRWCGQTFIAKLSIDTTLAAIK